MGTLYRMNEPVPSMRIDALEVQTPILDVRQQPHVYQIRGAIRHDPEALLAVEHPHVPVDKTEPRGVVRRRRGAGVVAKGALEMNVPVCACAACTCEVQREGDRCSQTCRECDERAEVCLCAHPGCAGGEVEEELFRASS